MKIAYLDCFSGISGNMCLGALVDAGVPLQSIESVLRRLPVSGWEFVCRKVVRGGVGATFVDVELDASEHHPHRGLSDVLDIIEGGDLPPEVAEDGAAVFRNLAEAEAKVHDTDMDSIHFHEVGAVDAICDIVGTVFGLHELGVECVLFSVVRLGGGTVEAAHGRLPVPAPATAELLKGVPTAGGPVEMELTTPTGAAVLKTLGEPSPQWPQMSIERLGYGAGGRDPEGVPNTLRLAVGNSESNSETESDCVWVLEANLDDMTGEEIGYCTEKLLSGGALDAFTAPVQMKKNRPGVRLTVLCPPERLRSVEELLWRHTSTLGVRRSLWQRSKLGREFRRVETPWGEVRVKVALRGGRVMRAAPEFEDCRAVAEANDVPLRRVYSAAMRAFEG
ncbi:MAG: nickel pincer cofactor biosynthesis protein LarC [Planctomycetota bacterium]